MTATGLFIAIFLALFLDRWVTEGIKTLLFMYARKKYEKLNDKLIQDLMAAQAMEHMGEEAGTIN